MKRLTAGLLSAAVLSAGVAAFAPPASADHCGHHYVRYAPRCRAGWGGGWGWGGGCRHYYRRDCDDDRGPNIGTLLLSAGAAYGAYRIYDDYRSRHEHHKYDDD